MQPIVEFTNPVRAELFDRLVGAVKTIGRDGLGRNRSYQTTFWYPRGRAPTNVAEETIVELERVLPRLPNCIGMEWWLGRLGYGRTLRFHFDRDLGLQKTTGKVVHPIWSSILYLNAFPSSPIDDRRRAQSACDASGVFPRLRRC